MLTLFPNVNFPKKQEKRKENGKFSPKKSPTIYLLYFRNKNFLKNKETKKKNGKKSSKMRKNTEKREKKG